MRGDLSDPVMLDKQKFTPLAQPAERNILRGITRSRFSDISAVICHVPALPEQRTGYQQLRAQLNGARFRQTDEPGPWRGVRG